MAAICLTSFGFLLGYAWTGVEDVIQSECWITSKGNKVQYIRGTDTIVFSDGSKVSGLGIEANWVRCETKETAP